ncbi:MAG: 16S rRNA (guanine(527)-N(7))-methyltransferase RsmG [Clostridia bacterium]|jgi:16S rRNA (guanine527-N7)-methyltransferase|nr:16S rRNA (guanine(527)-N(7))-methyltransferase RsmG [Clostridia bacterium]
MDNKLEYYDIMKKAFMKEDLNFTEETYEKFMTYMALIQEWNQKINLTAITEDEEIIKKHFIDSVQCYKFKEFHNFKTIIDIGTGAGFPGIPIKIADGSKRITLLDSLNKRIIFLNEVIGKLGLQDITAVHSRAEDLARKNEHREKYDCVVSRAVANMAVLSEYCLPYAKVGGYFIALKGPAVEEEILTAKKAISTLGGEIAEILPVDIEDTDLKHNIVIVKKVKNTAKAYPRKAGVISKKPIV